MTGILRPIRYAPSRFPIRAERSDATGDADQYGRNLAFSILRIFSIDTASTSEVYSRGMSGHWA